MPVLWEYCPVRIETFEGQHSGVVTNMFSNVTPWFTKSSWTRGMYSSVAASWSSVRIKTKFGLAPDNFRLAHKRGARIARQDRGGHHKTFLKGFDREVMGERPPCSLASGVVRTETQTAKSRGKGHCCIS